MANLVIEIPDKLAQRLKAIAAAEHKSIEQIAIERLSSELGFQPGSPAEVLRAVAAPPHLTSADVEELEAAIAGGRLPVRSNDVFPG
jgi:plasmid stability protein